MLAMNVNDNACFLNKRAALESIASKLAPTTESDLPRLRIRKKRPRIVLKTLQVIPALLHNQTRQSKAANPLTQPGETVAGHRHFALGSSS